MHMATKKTAKRKWASRERFTTSDHQTPFETRLSGFLEQQCPASDLTLADIKDIVWNESEHTLVSRMAFAMAEQNPKSRLDNILNMVNDAWNNFPHKKLNGLAPREMIERSEQQADFEQDDRPDFYTVFASTFPKTIRLVHQRDTDWSWEYPADFHTARAGLAAMREEIEKLYDSESDNDMDTEVEVMRIETGVSLAQACLDAEPLQFEAALLLARDAFEEGEPERALEVLESAIREGRKLFPSEFVVGTDHLPWHFTDNRPFLLLLGERATAIDSMHGPQRAIPFYEELLALNPNDNQGIRAFLATAYLKTGRLEDLLRLDANYSDDMMTELWAGTILALYKLGRLDEARARIKTMEKRGAHIFAEILRNDHPQPELTPGRVMVGGDDEAWYYWRNQGTFWSAARGAREFLRGEIGQQ